MRDERRDYEASFRESLTQYGGMVGQSFGPRPNLLAHLIGDAMLRERRVAQTSQSSASLSSRSADLPTETRSEQ